VTRVFIADDHALVRQGIRQVLREMGGFEVIGEAENGREVLRAPALAGADVLVLDLSMPKVNGPEVLRRIKARHPDLAVVVLSMYPEAQYAPALLAAGASAYVSKEQPSTDLVAAVQAAARGERTPPAPAPPNAAGAPAAPHGALTRRELQVFLLVVQGQAVADIAAELDVHSSTVSNHLARIREKLGVRTVAELVRYAHAAGLLDPGPRLGHR
jgi:two-component system, NarL family, invasion response regulator UvrY